MQLLTGAHGVVLGRGDAPRWQKAILFSLVGLTFLNPGVGMSATCRAISITRIIPGRSAEIFKDMSGNWVIADWSDVEFLSTVPDQTGHVNCMAKWLLNHRADVRITKAPNESCDNSDQLKVSLAQNDPAVIACKITTP